MTELPIIELQLREMGQQVRHAMLARKEEMQEYIDAGVERALKGAPDSIINAAMAEATKAVQREIENYFAYGPGRDAIKAAIVTALEPIRTALSK